MKIKFFHLLEYAFCLTLFILAFSFFCSCNNDGKENYDVEKPLQEPMIYTLVDKFKAHKAEQYKDYPQWYPLNKDSLYFNIVIYIEGNDTLLTISGSPYEEYCCMYDVLNYPQSTEFVVKKDSVFLIKRGKESIILYMTEPEQRPFLDLLIRPSIPTDIRDYVINYYPDEYIDWNACTYIYHQDSIFELLRPTD